LIRLSEARARVRLSEVVEESDVAEASRLLREAIKESATDPRTGLIDMDLLATGIGTSARGQLDALKGEVRKRIAQSATATLRWTNLYREMTEQSQMPIAIRDFEQVVNELETEQFIRLAGGRGQRTIRRLGMESNEG